MPTTASTIVSSSPSSQPPTSLPISSSHYLGRMKLSSDSKSTTREHEAPPDLPPISVLEEVPSPQTPQVVTVDDFLRQSGNQLPKITYRKSKRKFVDLLAGPDLPAARASGDAESPGVTVTPCRKRRHAPQDSLEPLLVGRSRRASRSNHDGHHTPISPSPPPSPAPRQGDMSTKRDKPPLSDKSSRRYRKYTAIPLSRPLPSSSRVVPPKKAKSTNPSHAVRHPEPTDSDPAFVPPLAFVPLEESLSGYAEFRRRLEG